MIRKLISMVFKLIYDKSDFVFYTIEYPETSERLFSEELKCYNDFDSGKAAFHRILKNWYLQPLFYRFKSGKATLITWEEDNEILAYGWLQSWSPFRRKFGKIFHDATMLGPYYTHPDHRGKGLYKKLLAYSVSLSPKEKPIAIYTSPENISSQKGIEASGFTKMGMYRVRFFFRLYSKVEKL